MQLHVQSYGSVTSTMDLAIAAAAAGAPEGLVIVADEQTAGRGRRGRRWSSPRGAGLYLSCLLRPGTDEKSSRVVSLITLGAGVAVQEGICQASGLAAELKWPNDVVVGRRKLAGILAEGLGLGSGSQAVVLGIGVNVTRASHPSDVADRATSLEEELGWVVDRWSLQEALLGALDEIYERLRRGEVDDILRAWRDRAPSAHGAAVEWNAPHGIQRGITAGLDASGALMVRTPQAIERVQGGELRWL